VEEIKRPYKAHAEKSKKFNAATLQQLIAQWRCTMDEKNP